jgi:hypothetical protein
VHSQEPEIGPYEPNEFSPYYYSVVKNICLLLPTALRPFQFGLGFPEYMLAPTHKTTRNQTVWKRKLKISLLNNNWAAYGER